MSNFDYPLLLKPISVPRPWGGGRICNLYERESVKADQPIGESWDVSTWPKDPGNPNLATVTTITNGSLAGKPLDEVVNVPVVVKILDSAQALSIQVHPVSENAHKDEMWYILHADKDAFLLCGLKDNVSKDEFCNIIHSSSPTTEQVMGSLKKAENLRPGMFFNVPTGTVHAVGPGLVAFEVSEQTQVTYRLYDYNRGRALHLEEGCKAVKTVRPDYPVLDAGLSISGANGEETITEFPTFCVIKATGGKVTVESSKHMHLVTATMGDCKISGPSSDWNIVLKHSFTCLVPATDKPYTIDTLGSGEVLFTPLKD